MKQKSVKRIINSSFSALTRNEKSISTKAKEELLETIRQERIVWRENCKPQLFFICQLLASMKTIVSDSGKKKGKTHLTALTPLQINILLGGLFDGYIMHNYSMLRNIKKFTKRIREFFTFQEGAALLRNFNLMVTDYDPEIAEQRIRDYQKNCQTSKKKKNDENI